MRGATKGKVLARIELAAFSDTVGEDVEAWLASAAASG
jgi:hypothetical protein